MGPRSRILTLSGLRSFSVGFLLVACVWVGVTFDDWRFGGSQGQTEQPIPADSRDEIVFMLLVSSGCSFSNAEDLPPAVRASQDSVRAVVGELGLSFATSGFAEEREAEAGARFLRRFGFFDEIHSGRGWRLPTVNSSAWTAFPIRREFPQVLILRRRDLDSWQPQSPQGAGVQPQILGSLTGIGEIRRLQNRRFVLRLISTGQYIFENQDFRGRRSIAMVPD